MTQKEIMQRISIINVKNKLELKEIYSAGEIIYVKCPFCYSPKGDMKLNIYNNTYICKNCEERGYSIGLYAKCKKISNKDAYKELIKNEPNIENRELNYIAINPMRSIDYLDNVYQAFLDKLSLSVFHTEKLIKLGFNNEEIEKIGFKTIPNDTSEEICNQLIEEGYELNGVPGFFQNNNFKWTFCNHKGIFIPIIENGKIMALRIHLDEEYKTDTKDIWFSSGNKYQGTKVTNSIMILYPQQNQIHIVGKEESKQDIIIVSEMILAYKLHTIYPDKTIIGIPNVITKNEIKKIEKIKFNNIYLVLDYHTLLHSFKNLLSTFIEKYGEDRVKTTFSVKECEIPINLDALLSKKERYTECKENIA